MALRPVQFICRENIGRSQVAEALYVQQSGFMARSAGIMVDHPGQRVADRLEADLVLEVMEADYGLDIGEQRRTPLAGPDGLRRFGKVIILAELEVVPEWLSEAPNAVQWDIPDLKGLDIEATRETIAVINQNIQDLLISA